MGFYFISDYHWFAAVTDAFAAVTDASEKSQLGLDYDWRRDVLDVLRSAAPLTGVRSFEGARCCAVDVVAFRDLCGNPSCKLSE